MKKQVAVASLVFLLYIATASAYAVQTVPELIAEEVHANQCRVVPLTVLISGGESVDIEFSISEDIEPFVHITKQDESHFHVYIHPSEAVVGQRLEGLLYVSTKSRDLLGKVSPGEVAYPVEITVDVLERNSLYDSRCPQLGPSVEVVPLSLDAITLLMLVLVSLGVVNVSARVRLNKKRGK